MRVPAALAVVPLLVGCAVGLIPSLQPPTGALVSAVAASLAFAAACGAFGMGSDEDCVAAIVAGCLCAGLSLGATAARDAYAAPLAQWYTSAGSSMDGVPVTVTGMLREDASSSGSGATLVVDVESVAPPPSHGGQSAGLAARTGRASGGVRISVAGEGAVAHMDGWRAGRRIRAPVLLRPAPYYLDPGVPDERWSLARRGVVLLGTVKSAALVDVVSRGGVIAERAAAARAWTRAGLDAAIGVWSRRSAAVARAVLIGDRTGLDDEDTRRLQDAGTYHVIAISGGNIAVLTVVLMAIARAVRFSPRGAPVVCVAALGAYAAIVVPGASVSRAVTAAVIYLGARALDQRAGSMNVIAVAAGGATALSPVVIFDPGFLLSFGAALGILLVVPRLEHPGRHASRWRRVGWIVLAATVTTAAAEAALLPIAAAIFGRVTFCGLILNFAAIPLMSVLQIGAMAALALEGWLPLARGAGLVSHLACEGILRSAAFADAWPALVRDVPAPAWSLVAGYYIAAVAWCVAKARRVRVVAAATMTGAAAVMVAGPWWAARDGVRPFDGLRVVVLDVGQADATAVLLPGGRAMLVDAAIGPLPSSADGAVERGFDAGARVVAPALRTLGVRSLEALILTHGDPDHIGGAPAVLRRFRPRSVWEGVPVPPHAGLRSIRDAARTIGASWRTVQAGDVERFGDVSVRVLHPPRPDWERQRVRNEDSVVLEIRLGDVAVVLPGDIGQEGERHVVDAIVRARSVDPGEPLPALVLKAPHHGSATSSSVQLLRTLAPEAVIVSAGRNNPYRHPAAVVVSRYRALGIPLISTQDGGAVFVDTDGHTVRVWSWR